MIQRARSFFRNSELGVSITVGVVGGLALYYALTAFVTGFVLPLLVQAFGRSPSGFRGTTAASRSTRPLAACNSSSPRLWWI